MNDLWQRRVTSRWTVACLCASAALLECASPPGPTVRSPAAVGAARTLVLFDDPGRNAWRGEVYATGIGALASHFGTWSALHVSAYRSGMMREYDAAIYLGSTVDQPLPAALLDDVLDGLTPVIWLGDNIGELAARAPDFVDRYGFRPWTFDPAPTREVRYKGFALPRRADSSEGILRFSALNETKARVQGWVVREDGTTVPWAVRARNLLYIGENPLAYVTAGDRYLAFCDLLFDVLAPRTVERHRALVRVEDINPRSSPEKLRAIADRLAQKGIPFAVAVIPVFEDPTGKKSGGAPSRLSLKEAPAVVEAIEYMLARGGSLVLHGYTHQYGTVPNPHDGVTGTDYEFYRVHDESDGRIVMDGPVKEDSAQWATDRVERALHELDDAGLPRPRVFEYPHNAGSATDSRAIARVLGTAFQRETYFSGTLAGAPERVDRKLGLVFPFVVDDIYGWRVLPENLGCYSAVASNPRAKHLPSDVLASARALRVVRDGVAGFYFDATDDLGALDSIVDGMQSLGYVFASMDAVASAR